MKEVILFVIAIIKKGDKYLLTKRMRGDDRFHDVVSPEQVENSSGKAEGRIQNQNNDSGVAIAPQND